MDTRAASDVAQRAEAAGLATAYEDCWGETRQVPAVALHDLLAATEGEAAAAASPLPPVIVLREGGARRITLALRAAAELVLEDGRALALGDGRTFELPAGVPPGYHRLRVRGRRVAAECALILCPDTCYLPPALQDGGRCWGVNVQLYALRSQRNWGIGDFGDLVRLLEAVALAGGAFVGLNPLHALNLQRPAEASPYSPSSRRWLNVLHIDVQALLDAQDRVALGAAFEARLQALRDAALIEHAGVAAAKLEVLRRLFDAGDAPPAWHEFRRTHGESLRRHALFEALQAHLQARDAAVWGWPVWPAELRDSNGAAVQAFAAAQAREIEFHEWLQWQADRQLQAAATRAATLGMAIGLYRDLAVGAAGGGSDTWALPQVHALDLRIGAPPDPLSPAGQDWGLPPLKPQALRDLAYAPFIETLRANMRGAGALRIDHVMALMRLFWIHPAHGAAGGAYRRYPHEELMAIVALESRRARCLVIGEDLGTVPPAMREAMRAHRMLSYCPLYFERDADGDFRPPEDWPAEALAVASTHDLPTLAGWWRGEDLRVREALGLYREPKQRDREQVERAADRLRLELALRRAALDPADLAGAVHAWLARAPSQMLGVQLEDVLQQVEAVNVPGTTHEQPNWRRKLSLAVEALGGEPRWQALARVLRRERPAWQPPLPSLESAEIPRATYRVQLHRGFGFREAARIVPQLAALGISHLYTSPVLKARPGSMHGYDVVDHDRLNPELGGEAGFDALCAALAAHGMKLLLDIVPNHMGVLEADNPWWHSVLALGCDSPHAGHFDIDWSSGKLLLPVLGAPYGEVLARGELRLCEEEGRWWLRYGNHRFPIDPRTMRDVPQDIDALDALIQHQHWRVAHWRLAGHEINYRRFFDVDALAAIRAERDDVFEASHRRVFEWLRDGRVAGLRIDHPDGLADPLGYLRRLQQRHAAMTQRALYLPVEKILADDEPLPGGWPVHGDTGYRFASDACAVLVDSRHAAAFDRLHADFIGERPDFDTLVRDAKRHVVETSLAADRERLVEAAWRLSRDDRSARDFSRAGLREAISALATGFTVYRSYLDGGEPRQADLARVAEAAHNARQCSVRSLAPAIDWLQRLLQDARDEPAMGFVRRFQQFTAPLMAKAVEDTAFYRFHRLVCLNDVGADPRRFGLTVGGFHRRNAMRRERTPHTLLATSTHDSKRSEDVRARLAVLSEMPHQWRAFAERWRADLAAPSPNDQFLLLQTLVGVWPLGEVDLGALSRRVRDFMLKAVREAKQHTSWTEPDAAYEAALAAHVERLLAPGSAFVDDLRTFVAPVARFGACNSLALVTLKLTCPGVPDLYQGCEGWHFALVDPDNRGVPDFDRLQRALAGAEAPLAELREGLADGRLKTRVTARLLQWRRREPQLWRDGSYEPLVARGDKADHVIAFARRHGDAACITLAARLPWQLAAREPQALFDDGRCWHDTTVVLPAGAPRRWRDLISDREVEAGSAGLCLADVLRELTVAVLVPC